MVEFTKENGASHYSGVLSIRDVASFNGGDPAAGSERTDLIPLGYICKSKAAMVTLIAPSSATVSTNARSS
jgi:hypothetical protein